MRILLLALFAASLPGAGSAGSAPTVDDFLSLPTRMNLVTGAERGGCAGLAAWIELRRGVSNVFVSRAVSCGAGVQATNFTADDGNALSSLALAPRGDGECMIVFVSGPTESANPNSQVLPPGFSTWVGVTSVWPPRAKKLMDRGYDAISPDGMLLAYVTGGGDDGLTSSRVFSTSVLPSSGSDRLLFGVKQGTIEELEWTVDSTGKASRLLFSNPRGDHGFVGLWVEGASRLRWISASVDTDRNPRMSPDGTRVAFLRMLGPQHEGDRGLGGHRGPNYEVWVADLTSKDKSAGARFLPMRTGHLAPRMVYKEYVAGYPDGGSGYGERNLEWLDASVLVFGDESSGWCHPVALDVSSEASEIVDLVGRDSSARRNLGSSEMPRMDRAHQRKTAI